MRVEIHTYLPPDAQTLLILEPEELAGLLLEYLLQESQGGGSVNLRNVATASNFQNYPPEHQEEISLAVSEAWAWLEHEGIVALDPRQSNQWEFVTRRGRKLANRTGLQEYVKAKLLPTGLLHPEIAKVYPAFLRGEYDTAVFQAFREVEVAVRNKGNFALTETGVDLMRKAFNETTGPLSDINDPIPERQAVSHLFAGAFGYLRNPSGHRNVTFQPEEAVEVIMLANHLMRIVDSRP